MTGIEYKRSTKINLENPSAFNSIVAELIILESENGIFENFKFILKSLNLSIPVLIKKISHTIKLKVTIFKILIKEYS